jgi:hypothetical protein
MAIFRIASDGTAIYGNTRLQWRAPKPISPAALGEALRSGDTASAISALQRASLPLSRECEGILASLLKNTADADLASVAALRLRFGGVPESIGALKAAYSSMLARDELMAAMELVAALTKRGRSRYFTHFVAHLSSQGRRLDAKMASELIGISMLRGLPLRRWSEQLIGKLPTSGPGRFVAARVFLAKRLPKGRQIVLQALGSPEKADREQAIKALGETRAIGTRRLLRNAFNSERSIELELLCAEYLKRTVAVRTRSALVSKGADHDDPLIRYRTTRQLEWLPSKQRRQLARRWLDSEADVVVKNALRPWLKKTRR